MSAFLYFLQITKGVPFPIYITVSHCKQVGQSTNLTIKQLIPDISIMLIVLN